MFTKMHKVITFIDQEDQETEKIEFTNQVLKLQRLLVNGDKKNL